jgi:hypothetical protein
MFYGYRKETRDIFSICVKRECPVRRDYLRGIQDPGQFLQSRIYFNWFAQEGKRDGVQALYYQGYLVQKVV